MKRSVIVDTGPLVAWLDRRDANNEWVNVQLQDIQPPLITCEAVIAEATYLTRNIAGARLALIEMVRDGFLKIGMQLDAESTALAGMVKRYADVPMSLADACLVRLAELHASSVVLTLDSDFTVYKKNGRQTIALIKP